MKNNHRNLDIKSLSISTKKNILEVIEMILDRHIMESQLHPNFILDRHFMFKSSISTESDNDEFIIRTVLAILHLDTKFTVIGTNIIRTNQDTQWKNLFDGLKRLQLQIENNILKIPKKNQLVLILNTDGYLFRKDKPALRYPLSKEFNRKRLIEHLASSKKFTSTENICQSIGARSNGAIRSAIHTINTKCYTLLKLKSDLIIGKHGDGYRIDPQYKIEGAIS